MTLPKPQFVAVALALSLVSVAGCGRTGLAPCSMLGLSCLSSDRLAASKVNCDCSCVSGLGDAVDAALGLPITGRIPSCLPAEINGPLATSADARAALLAMGSAEYNTRLIGVCGEVGVALTNVAQGLSGTPPGSLCGFGHCSCTVEATTFDSPACDSPCADTLCDLTNCPPSVRVGRTIDIDSCMCTRTAFCGQPSSPVLCRSPAGSGDPPDNPYGLLGALTELDNAFDVDPTSSGATMTAAFSDDLGIGHSATAVVAGYGHANAYGRPNDDGSGNYVLDLGLTFDDFTMAFQNVDIVGDVSVAVTDIRVSGGTGRVAVSVDSSGIGFIPADVLTLVLQASQNGEVIEVRTSNAAPVPLLIDIAGGSFEIPALGFAVANVTGTVSLKGTVTNRPPTAAAGRDVARECESPDGASVVLDASATTDLDGTDINYAWFAGDPYDPSSFVGAGRTITTQVPSGSHTYLLRALDRGLQADYDDVVIDVTDTTSPTLTASASTACLWPPAHDVVLLELGSEVAAEVVDACDPTAEATIVDVQSDEAPLGSGSGRTEPDVAFGPHSLCIRAERDGTRAEGRTYSITLRAVDGSGNATDETITVRVPHDGSTQSCTSVSELRTVYITDPRCVE